MKSPCSGQHVTFSRKLEPARNTDNPDTDALAPGFEEGAYLPATDSGSGEIRLAITPRDAEVYADGFYVGRADDFDGGQHLMLTEGQHHLVLRREGYEAL